MKKYNRFFFKKKISYFFSQYITIKSSGLEEDRNIEENINKGVRNLFRSNKLKKETNDAAIKGIRNLSRQKNKIKQLKTE